MKQNKGVEGKEKRQAIITLYIKVQQNKVIFEHRGLRISLREPLLVAEKIRYQWRQ